MKIEVNDDLILFSTSGDHSNDELKNTYVRIQIGEYTDNYSEVNIDQLIMCLEAMKARK